jgi:hypothetical protein
MNFIKIGSGLGCRDEWAQLRGGASIGEHKETLREHHLMRARGTE